jgi:hypothetical protein
MKAVDRNFWTVMARAIGERMFWDIFYVATAQSSRSLKARV